MLALLEILQAGGTRTVAEIADRLAVDERTVRRYIGLLDELGVPVTSVRGRYGGYRLARGYRMPPLMLTEDEALAVLLGLLAGRRAGLLTIPAQATEAAIAKVRRVLPVPVRQRLDALIDTMGFTIDERPAVSTGTDLLLTLAGAARDSSSVLITYTDRSGNSTERTVDPYGVVSHAGRWYVTGPDSASGQLRTFRVDRIGSARPLSNRFTPAPHGFDPTAAVLSSLAGTPYAHRVRIRVQATIELTRTVFPPGLATIEDSAEPGWLQVRLQAENLNWVPRLLATLDHPFVIDEPGELRDRVRELGTRLVAGADRPDHESADRRR